MEILVDVALYPIESVMGAAYVFVDRCYVFLDKDGDGKVKISLTEKQGAAAGALGDLAGEFRNELLAQALRHQIARRHEKERELILARALFGAAPRLAEAAPTDEQLGVDPQDLPAEDDSYLDDPLGIAVPWEEKYGKAATAPEAPAVAGGPGTPERDR